MKSPKNWASNTRNTFLVFFKEKVGGTPNEYRVMN
jgi:hypothetical protein